MLMSFYCISSANALFGVCNQRSTVNLNPSFQLFSSKFPALIVSYTDAEYFLPSFALHGVSLEAGDYARLLQ